MPSVEEPVVLYPPRFRMAAVALGMMALSVLLLWDVPNIYDGLIRGDKFKWLLNLPPLARAGLMGGLGAFILLAAIYLMIWVMFAKPAKISQEGIEAYPRLFWRSFIRWDDAAVIEVRKEHVIIRSEAGSHSSPIVRIPLRRKRDCLNLPKGAIRDGVIYLDTSKTGEEMPIPMHPGLRMILDGAPAHKGETIAATTYGTPWTTSGFNSVWDRFKDKLHEDGEIGAGLTIHGLRHTVGDMLAESEAGLDEIRRALGQKTLAMAQHYSERAKKRSAVRMAVEKLDPLGTRECLTVVSNPVAGETDVQ